MPIYYCLNCLNRIKTRKLDRAGKVQCRDCGKRRTVKLETFISAVKRLSDLPTPIEEIGDLNRPLKGIDQFPILKLLQECDGRVREPLRYLSTRVRNVYEKWKDMSPEESLDESLFEDVVKKAREDLLRKGAISLNS